MRPTVALVPLALLAVGVVAAPVPKVKEQPATEEQRKEVQDNLRRIGLALQVYAGEHKGTLPADVLDADSKPLLSWRVLLLPHLGEEDLFRQFKLDEPWDGETNKKLIEKLPKIYVPVRVKVGAGETFYRGFAGAGKTGGAFEPGSGVKLTRISDGCSETIAVIDAGEPVIWTKPGTDLDPDAKDFPTLGRMTDGDFYCVMCEGSVRTVKREFDAKQLKAAVSRAAGDAAAEGKVFVK